MWVHELPDDLVVEEGGMPHASDAREIRQLGQAECGIGAIGVV